jgi:spore coat polysaccharide biosynthesis protein SpsF (cytidylyltransferase family)
MVKIVAIVQARMGSTRLPGKVMMEICGKEVLLHIIDRLKACKLLDKIVIATTLSDKDDVIFDAVNNYDKSIGLFRGSEENVLERYYLAAKKFDADIIVRVTSDDPLIDPKGLDLLIQNFLDSDCDYCSNNMIRTFPLGIDAEVFSYKALEKAWKEAPPFEKEHVTEYIINNQDKFKLINVKNGKDLSHLRWTLDYPEDFIFIKEVYERLYSKDNIFDMDDILELLNKEPYLTEINKKYVIR